MKGFAEMQVDHNLLRKADQNTRFPSFSCEVHIYVVLDMYMHFNM